MRSIGDCGRALVLSETRRLPLVTITFASSACTLVRLLLRSCLTIYGRWLLINLAVAIMLNIKRRWLLVTLSGLLSQSHEDFKIDWDARDTVVNYVLTDEDSQHTRPYQVRVA